MSQALKMSALRRFLPAGEPSRKDAASLEAKSRGVLDTNSPNPLRMSLGELRQVAGGFLPATSKKMKGVSTGFVLTRQPVATLATLFEYCGARRSPNDLTPER